jgi:hypothetical protein
MGAMHLPFLLFALFASAADAVSGAVAVNDDMGARGNLPAAELHSDEMGILAAVQAEETAVADALVSGAGPAGVAQAVQDTAVSLKEKADTGTDIPDLLATATNEANAITNLVSAGGVTDDELKSVTSTTVLAITDAAGASSAHFVEAAEAAEAEADALSAAAVSGTDAENLAQVLLAVEKESVNVAEEGGADSGDAVNTDAVSAATAAAISAAAAAGAPADGIAKVVQQNADAMVDAVEHGSATTNLPKVVSDGVFNIMDAAAQGSAEGSSDTPATGVEGGDQPGSVVVDDVNGDGYSDAGPANQVCSIIDLHADSAWVCSMAICSATQYNARYTQPSYNARYTQPSYTARYTQPSYNARYTQPSTDLVIDSD